MRACSFVTTRAWARCTGPDFVAVDGLAQALTPPEYVAGPESMLDRPLVHGLAVDRPAGPVPVLRAYPDVLGACSRSWIRCVPTSIRARRRSPSLRQMMVLGCAVAPEQALPVYVRDNVGGGARHARLHAA